MNNSKKGLVIVILLSVILVGVIVIGTIKDRHDNKKNAQEYEEFVQSEKDDSEEGSTDSDVEDTSASGSSKAVGLVEKLKAKSDVQVLILGDDMAMSYGKNSEAGIWSNGIKNLLQSTYGSNANIKLVAEEGATTDTGVKALSKEEIKNNDLVILCYGNNDAKSSVKIENVKQNYTQIVTKIKEASPNAIIISVLESSLQLNNAYRIAISEIATSNSILIADMRKAFDNSGMNETAISKNGFPNDKGYQIYTNTIGDRVKEAMS